MNDETMAVDGVDPNASKRRVMVSQTARRPQCRIRSSWPVLSSRPSPTLKTARTDSNRRRWRTILRAGSHLAPDNRVERLGQVITGQLWKFQHGRAHVGTLLSRVGRSTGTSGRQISRSNRPVAFRNKSAASPASGAQPLPEAALDPELARKLTRCENTGCDRDDGHDHGQIVLPRCAAIRVLGVYPRHRLRRGRVDHRAGRAVREPDEAH